MAKGKIKSKSIQVFKSSKSPVSVLHSLHEQFTVTGYFYNAGHHTFRKYLNIRHNLCSIVKPDLMVIMMNPGSSHPVGTKNYKEIPVELLNREVLTFPDNTQTQIMKVMRSFNFQYARVLNLSDVCEASSKAFYKLLKVLDSKEVNHSIFNEKNKESFQDLFNIRAEYIVAWGVNKKLQALAEEALERVGTKRVGWHKEGVAWAYYHPLQHSRNKQNQWIDIVVKQIKANGPKNTTR